MTRSTALSLALLLTASVIMARALKRHGPPGQACVQQQAEISAQDYWGRWAEAASH
jgi:hypothetical protein